MIIYNKVYNLSLVSTVNTKPSRKILIFILSY